MGSHTGLQIAVTDNVQARTSEAKLLRMAFSSKRIVENAILMDAGPNKGHSSNQIPDHFARQTTWRARIASSDWARDWSLRMKEIRRRAKGCSTA